MAVSLPSCAGSPNTDPGRWETAASWLTLHAAVHVYDATCGSSPLADVQRDFVGIYLLAAIPLALAVFRKPKGAPDA